MSDRYLWDGSGVPDRDVQRLEQLLGPLRSAPPPLHLPEPSLPGRSRRHVWRLIPLLAAAACIVMLVGTWRATRNARPVPPAWDVARLTGQPLISGHTVGDTGRLAVGETLVTDASSSALIHVGAIGDVTIAGNTRVRLVETRADHHQLSLDRGTLRAIIVAPPGQFVVETRSATATDLGCVYTLHVDDDGGGMLSVEAGWVAFELNGRESFVPAGASCPMDAAAGPGTPRYDDADLQFRESLERVDFGRGADRSAALSLVLTRARPRDALTLWHLLPRVGPDERGDVYAALVARVTPPADVRREAVLALDRDALDRWWNALGLGDTAFWRRWKRQL